MIFVWILFWSIMTIYFLNEGLTSLIAFFPQSLEKVEIDMTDLENLPKISVVIPCRNEELIIEKALSKWLKIDYPYSHLEVIVADNSTDKTEELVKIFAKDNDCVKYYRVNSKSKIEALQQGLEHAHYDFIFLCDADILVEPDCIKTALPYLCHPNNGCVFGTRIPPIDNMSLLQSMMGLRELFVSVKLKFYSLIDSTPWISLSPGAFNKKDLLNALKDYDPKIIADDLYFAVKIRQNGKYVKYVPNMLAKSGVIGTYEDLWIQNFRGSQAVAQAISRSYHQSLFTTPSLYGYIVVPFKFFSYVLSYTLLPLFLIVSVVSLHFELILYYYLMQLVCAISNYICIKSMVKFETQKNIGHFLFFPIGYTIAELVWAMGWLGWIFQKRTGLTWKKTISDRI